MDITVKNLKKSFDETKALNGVSFNVKTGEAFGLLGRNGAGKTTIIRSILGIINQDSGEILLDGKDIRKSKVRFGYLPEERGLYLKYKVSEQLIYFGQLNGLNKSKAKQSILYWLDKFHVSNYYNRRVDELSKGNKQKIQLIAAILHDPDIIILDEPFSGLDPVNVELFKNIIKDLLNKNKTLLFSSHQMNDVDEFCSNIAMLKSGQIVLQGSIDELKEKYSEKQVLVSTYENIRNIINEMNIKEVEIKGNNYILEYTSSKTIKEFLSKLLSLNLHLEKFEYLKPSLNDIFLKQLGD
ncbi:ABC transporter ATP-binding protein [Clostridium tagluense]|uniref:ABC transporter ATP-binding protein n=1 Tax=Clostridium tagluense TaxID=360422 RepID=UPI001C0E3CD9|nr:ATP-binding cassette domain-containing protein [Clostridium tagluense]MBU3130207.1 ATP-binding cassette domain-containing protein [Clostridium tagluense]